MAKKTFREAFHSAVGRKRQGGEIEQIKEGVDHSGFRLQEGTTAVQDLKSGDVLVAPDQSRLGVSGVQHLGGGMYIIDFEDNTSTPPVMGSQTVEVSESKLREFVGGISLYALYIGDGYLSAASEEEYQLEQLARHQGESDFEVVPLYGVPPELQSRLLVQGTYEQSFSDGYEAANAAAPYTKDLPRKFQGVGPNAPSYESKKKRLREDFPAGTQLFATGYRNHPDFPSDRETVKIMSYRVTGYDPFDEMGSDQFTIYYQPSGVVDGPVSSNLGSIIRGLEAEGWTINLQTESKKRRLHELELDDLRRTLPEYTVAELEAMPTIHSGQYANLKVDTGEERVWLSRMTAADGEEFAIEHERLINGVWSTIAQYGTPKWESKKRLRENYVIVTTTDNLKHSVSADKVSSPPGPDRQFIADSWFDHDLLYAEMQRLGYNRDEILTWTLSPNQFGESKIREGLRDDPATWHQVQIAKKTLRMPDAMVGVMGGPDKAQSREILRTKAGWSDERISKYEAYEIESKKRLREDDRKDRWFYGYMAWVNNMDRSQLTDPVELEGFDAAADDNDGFGDRPTRDDAEWSWAHQESKGTLRSWNDGTGDVIGVVLRGHKAAIFEADGRRSVVSSKYLFEHTAPLAKKKAARRVKELRKAFPTRLFEYGADTYEGWVNHDTWLVALIVDNDYGMYQKKNDFIASKGHNANGADIQAFIRSLGQAFYQEYLQGEGEPGFDHIGWDELAGHWNLNESKKPRLREGVRTLSPAEIEAAESYLRSYGGQSGPSGFTVGGQVKWQHTEWKVYDFQAESSAPDGVELVLISPDNTMMASGVQTAEVSLFESIREEYSGLPYDPERDATMDGRNQAAVDQAIMNIQAAAAVSPSMTIGRAYHEWKAQTVFGPALRQQVIGGLRDLGHDVSGFVESKDFEIGGSTRRQFQKFSRRDISRRAD